MKSNHIFSSKCTTHLKQTLQRVAEQPAPLSLARVLDALAAERGSIAAELLKKSLKTNATKRALAPGSVRDELKTESLSHPPRYPKTVIISETAAHILVKAVHISAQHGHRYVGTEHLLKSLLETKSDEVY
ncbi:MAG: hypothetical protein HYW81_00220, partial [Parcubacteria group bacterium]|nr:hypothetical protein [Parcubacteria group bacterium]